MASDTIDVAASPADMSVAELGARFREGSLSPVEAAEAALARIDAFEPVVNAFVHQDPAHHYRGKNRS